MQPPTANKKDQVGEQQDPASSSTHTPPDMTIYNTISVDNQDFPPEHNMFSDFFEYTQHVPPHMCQELFELVSDELSNSFLENNTKINNIENQLTSSAAENNRTPVVFNNESAINHSNCHTSNILNNNSTMYQELTPNLQENNLVQVLQAFLQNSQNITQQENNVDYNTSNHSIINYMDLTTLEYGNIPPDFFDCQPSTNTCPLPSKTNLLDMYPPETSSFHPPPPQPSDAVPSYQSNNNYYHQYPSSNIHNSINQIKIKQEEQQQHFGTTTSTVATNSGTSNVYHTYAIKQEEEEAQQQRYARPIMNSTPMEGMGVVSGDIKSLPNLNFHYQTQQQYQHSYNHNYPFYSNNNYTPNTNPNPQQFQQFQQYQQTSALPPPPTAISHPPTPIITNNQYIRDANGNMVERLQVNGNILEKLMPNNQQQPQPQPQPQPQHIEQYHHQQPQQHDYETVLMAGGTSSKIVRKAKSEKKSISSSSSSSEDANFQIVEDANNFRPVSVSVSFSSTNQEEFKSPNPHYNIHNNNGSVNIGSNNGSSTGTIPSIISLKRDSISPTNATTTATLPNHSNINLSDNNTNHQFNACYSTTTPMNQTHSSPLSVLSNYQQVQQQQQSYITRQHTISLPSPSHIQNAPSLNSSIIPDEKPITQLGVTIPHNQSFQSQSTIPTNMTPIQILNNSPSPHLEKRKKTKKSNNNSTSSTPTTPKFHEMMLVPASSTTTSTSSGISGKGSIGGVLLNFSSNSNPNPSPSPIPNITTNNTPLTAASTAAKKRKQSDAFPSSGNNSPTGSRRIEFTEETNFGGKLPSRKQDDFRIVNFDSKEKVSFIKQEQPMFVEDAPISNEFLSIEDVPDSIVYDKYVEAIKVELTLPEFDQSSQHYNPKRDNDVYSLKFDLIKMKKGVNRLQYLKNLKKVQVKNVFKQKIVEEVWLGFSSQKEGKFKIRTTLNHGSSEVCQIDSNFFTTISGNGLNKRIMKQHENK